MTKQEIKQYILKERIILAARGLQIDEALPFAEAVYAGGLRLLEITFDQASPTCIEDAVRKIALLTEATDGRMLIGAGTVLTIEQAEAAVNAGAKYLLSPSLDRDVLEYAVSRGVVMIPGVMTPTEAQNATLWGADMVKLFPTGSLGIPYIKAIRAPLSHIPMIAMGGVNEQNLREYLAVCAGVGIGSGIFNRALLDAKDYAEITRRARAFAEQTLL